MARIVLAGVIAGLCVSLAIPVSAQITNEACVLRCLDRGNLDQTCQARCTKGVPPASVPAPNRSGSPANVATPGSVPQAPAAPMGPAPAVAAPSVQPPSAQSAPQPAAQAAPPVPANQLAPQPAAQSAPQIPANQVAPQPTAQATPQQSVKPPAPPPRPVNQACVLRCLEHGRLDQYCQSICAR